ncbi:hypothetical protein ACFWPK_03520 [Nocardia sp. NPDC058519]|uniref:hypothetical protein n=1 Tax=Nocardia sp. NPDC058519 TaxID=3346535 RepID=UPI00365ADD50
MPTDQRWTDPDPGTTTTDTTPEKPISHGSRDIRESASADAEPVSGPSSIEPTPAGTEFVAADLFATWGEPGDGTGIAPGSWLPDDNLILSDDWWDWPS